MRGGQGILIIVIVIVFVIIIISTSTVTRSVSFKGNILTIGTGIGLMLFWDLRASKFLESTMNSNRAVTLKASRGWVVSCTVVVSEVSLVIVVSVVFVVPVVSVIPVVSVVSLVIVVSGVSGVLCD